ncbi:hypothetical protein DOT_2996 [Desulfosporosinus sp. OT]|nr:hypothetical protein DOT_2996 [Desulfosporosinus sp. OT]
MKDFGYKYEKEPKGSFLTFRPYLYYQEKKPGMSNQAT